MVREGQGGVLAGSGKLYPQTPGAILAMILCEKTATSILATPVDYPVSTVFVRSLRTRTPILKEMEVMELPKAPDLWDDLLIRRHFFAAASSFLRFGAMAQDATSANVQRRPSLWELPGGGNGL